MTAVATFDPAAWKARYPEFANVPDGMAVAYFNEATLYHRNDGCGPGPTTVEAQTMLLWMVTAHVAARYSNSAGTAQPSNTLVGRISQAAEGSVNVTTEMGNATTASEAWWNQTKYGSDYWRLMAPYRTARYVPGPVGRGLALGPYVGRFPWH